MDQGEDVHPFGSTGEKNLGAFIHRRARRIDIVDEKNPLLFHLFSCLRKNVPLTPFSLSVPLRLTWGTVGLLFSRTCFR